MAGVTESAVRNYELGLRAPRPQHLEALAQKLDAAVRAWAAMRARRDSGEISEEEYLDWKRGFGKESGGAYTRIKFDEMW